MAKILYVSDSPTISTGYGRVTSVLAQAFHDAGHHVTCVGWGYQEGEPHDFPFKIIPCDSRQENFGEDKVADFIRNERPDILFTLGDPWMFEFVPEMEERKAVSWMCYFPIDGYPIPPNWHDWMRNIDIPVVFSDFSRKLVKDIIKKEPVFIPHGVDTDVFKPLEEGSQSTLKKNILGRDDVFVVGCVARNQPRKNLPALIKGFAKFARNKEDVALYLHCQIRDVGWNLDELVVRFGLEDKAYSTSGFQALYGIPSERLNEIYNLFDIMALPTMAEGFGLPILESQSAGTPVLVTDFSACTELVVSPQELIKVKDTLVMGRGIEQAIADTDDLANKLNFFYHDWKKRKGATLNKLGEQGRQKALQMDWKDISNTFLEEIAKIDTASIDKEIKPVFYTI